MNLTAKAHVSGDQIERAYKRTDLFQKWRRLMQEWVRYCCSPPAAGDVVSLRKQG